MNGRTKTIAAAAVVCVAVILLIGFAMSEKEQVIRQDIVVGDYIDLEIYELDGENYAFEMTVQEIYDHYLHLDTTSMEYLGDVVFEYYGNDIDCEMYFEDNITFYVTKISQVVLHYTDSKSDTVYDLVYEDFYLDEPFECSDIKEGMVLTYTITSEDRLIRNRCSVGPIDEEGNTVLRCLIHQGDRTVQSFKVVSVDGDMVTLDDGSELSKDNFLMMITYKSALREVKNNADIISTECGSEYQDLLLGEKVYDYFWIYGTSEGDESEIVLYHDGDVLLYTNRYSFDSDGTISAAFIKVLDTSLIDY